MSKFENYHVSILDRNKEINNNFLKLKLSINKTQFIKDITFLTNDFQDKIDFLLIDKNKYYIENCRTIEIEKKLYGINEIILYFKETYLEKCKKEEYIIGYYYPKCNCCVEDFRILKEDFDNENIDFEKKREEITYSVYIPEIRLNIYYEISKGLNYDPNIY
jgi:hypothetical protein